MQMFCFLLFHKIRKLSAVFFSFFSFCCSDLISSALYLSSRILFSASSSLLLNPSSIFFQWLYSALWLLFDTFLYFLPLLKFSLCLSVLPCLVSIFMTVILNSLLGKQTTYLHFIKISFWGLVLSFLWNIFLFLTFPDFLCWFLCIKQPTLPVLQEWFLVGDEPYCSALS